MNAEIAAADAATLREIAKRYQHMDGPGAGEVAFLLLRAARLAEAIGGDAKGADTPTAA